MYRKFGIVLTINAVMMFVITYAMIDSVAHFYLNINRAYMALMMVAPMAILMLVVMRSMYDNLRLNAVLIAVFLVLGLGSFLLARTQTPIGDQQFIRSMIPHHSSAILMCEQSTITDAELVALCDEIVQTQKEEIAQMEDVLARLD
jgi:uncharacterized protein (DUF305 family)